MTKRKNQGPGRPRIYQSAAEMEKDIEAYFQKCHELNEYPTVTGLAASLEMSRDTLVKYGYREEYADTVKKARVRIEAEYEKLLLEKGRNPVGVIFSLKNNFGWKDQKTVEVHQYAHLTDDQLFHRIRLLEQELGISLDGADVLQIEHSKNPP